ncbi:MAG: GspE/PulE family protein, partial [Gemmatimonadota bacterium]|nr:GspE/PulE family protein [Gemmatimonadota bacterium]
GKIHVKVEGREIDIRVSNYVSMFGETIVMRLLDRDRSIVKVSQLGFQPRVEALLSENVLRASSGLVLLVGPTGSGKTTTLYSFVDHANDPSRKVITCEDPVEYVMDGIVQCSVDVRAGRTFAASLRSIVRQDPDTIVVGEMRDRETASLAIEAALTGHKVFSTFHTEEAVGAFVRLLEMGLEPFLVSSTVSAVIAQRLVRRLCPRCKVPVRPKLAELRFLNLTRAETQEAELCGPVGCKDCGGTGYKGRMGLHEVVVPTDAFRQAVLDRASTSELRLLARELSGFVSMQEDGLLKAMTGLTSLAEIIENAPRDSTPRSLPDLRRVANSRRAK